MTVLTTFSNGGSLKDYRDTFNSILGRLTALEAGGATTPTKMGFAGDSITAYSTTDGGWSSYARLIAAATPSKTFRNSAVGGSVLGNPGDATSVNSCYARLAADLAFGPDVQALLIGANELPYGASSVQAAYAERCFVFLDQFKAIGSKVIICTALERASATSFTSTMRANLNSIFRAAKTSGRIDDVIDFDTSIAGANGASADGAIFPDGTHPSATAQIDMANVARPVIYHWVEIANEPLNLAFAPQAAATADTDYDSSIYTVTGLYPGESRPYSTVGKVKKNSGSFVTDGSGTVVNGDTLRLRNHSSIDPATQTDVFLTVGTTTATYSVTTAGVGSRDWIPTDLGSKLKLWLRPEGISGADDTAMATWPDSSGNSITVTGVGYGSAPHVKAAGLNGFKTVKFASSYNQAGFTLPSGYLTGRTAGAGFFVHRLDVDPPTGGIAPPMRDWGSGANGEFYPYPSDRNVYSSFGSADRQQSPPPPNLASAWRIGSFHAATSDWRYYVDGTAVHTTTSNTFTNGTAPKIAGGGENLDGQIAEIIDCTSALTTTERQLVEGYLAWKFGLAGNLPSGHPYKSAKPTI